MRIVLLIICTFFSILTINGQELSAKVNINHQQIQGTDNAIFEELKEKLEEIMNTQQWTPLKFLEQERISCSFNITVKEYKREDGIWVCSCMIQANRPVYNSSYTTTVFQFQDNDFTFVYHQFDNLNYNEEIIDNQLLALFAYYSYLIIGMDLDSFSPKGGSDVLNRCLNLTNNAQNLDFPGWKAYDSNKNRFAIINDYMEGAMEPFRLLQYDYYRKGLDEMANNAERGSTEISTAITEDLQKAHKDRSTSMLPQIWTDYKKDELANIYKGKGTSKEKEQVYDVLFSINPSQSNSWDKIKQ